MYRFAFIFLLFLLFSLFGYLVEMIFVMIKSRRLSNRGFLCGPVIPIYGIGGVLMIGLTYFKHNPFIVFFLGMTVATILEYITGFFLEKIFHNKWWDYSKEKCNLHGYICLGNSILFGLGSLLIVYIAYPVMHDFLRQLRPEIIIGMAFVFFVIYLADSIYSIVVAYNLRNRIIIVEELKKDKLSKIPFIFEKKLKESVKTFKRFPTRLLKAFPYLTNAFESEFTIMKEIQDKKIKKPTEKKKKQSKKNKKKK